MIGTLPLASPIIYRFIFIEEGDAIVLMSMLIIGEDYWLSIREAATKMLPLPMIFYFDEESR